MAMNGQSEAIRKPIWVGDSADRLLHILPQSDNHCDCEIFGAPDALRRLGEALILAADSGADGIVENVMPRDGEYYRVRIKPRDQWQMQEVPVPYAQLGHIWDFDPPAATYEATCAATLEQAQGRIDLHILEKMENDRDPAYPRCGYGFHLRHFVVEPFLTRDMVRAACRSLTDRGYAVYLQSLWTDDGIPCGAGYGITDRGADYLAELQSQAKEVAA